MELPSSHSSNGVGLTGSSDSSWLSFPSCLFSRCIILVHHERTNCFRSYTVRARPRTANLHSRSRGRIAVRPRSSFPFGAKGQGNAFADCLRLRRRRGRRRGHHTRPSRRLFPFARPAAHAPRRLAPGPPRADSPFTPAPPRDSLSPPSRGHHLQ